MPELIRSRVSFINDVRLAGVDEDTVYLQSTLCDEVIQVEDIATTIVNHAPRAVPPQVDLGGVPSVRIGDCKAPRTVEEAVYEGLTAANDFILGTGRWARVSA